MRDVPCRRTSSGGQRGGFGSGAVHPSAAPLRLGRSGAMRAGHYEAYTHEKTLNVYKAQLGVRSPRDDDYKPDEHRDISCPLH